MPPSPIFLTPNGKPGPGDRRPPIPWLESIWGARVSLCLLIIWVWLGYNMVIMLAGLQTIPRELTEAAMIDGANPVQSFFHVTIPLMRPVILFCVVLSLMGSFNLFNEVFILTAPAGGPMNATITPFVDIFNQAFGNNRFGYASAMAYGPGDRRGPRAHPRADRR